MNCRIFNNSDMNLNRLLPVLKLFLPYAQKHMGFDQPVDIEFVSDKKNAKKLLGKTAYYDPSENRICVFVDKRHPKDMMKSIAHELAHHTQNCRGDLDLARSTDPGYAQNDKHMRKMEDEAYKTLLLFRDFEDTHRHLIETHLKGEVKMSYKNWRDQEINDRLMESWGYKAPKNEQLNESVEIEEAAHVDEKDLELNEEEELNEEDELEEGAASSGRQSPNEDRHGKDPRKRPMEENIVRRAVREALIQKLKK